MDEFNKVIGVRAKFKNGNSREMTGLSNSDAKWQFAAWLRRDDVERVEYITKGYTRAAALDLIWRDTHADFKGTMDGVRTILVLRGGTCLVALDGLTDNEIADRLQLCRNPIRA